MAELTRKEVILILANAPHVALAGNAPATRRQPPGLGVRLAGVDLSGLDLTGLNLAHADLAGADLRGANLSDARLSDADLSRANLTDAQLRGVFAERAIFTEAKLVRADLRASDRDLFYGTHLLDADFQGADLTDAHLAGVQLAGARFSDAILRGADLALTRMNEHTILNGARFDARALDQILWAEPSVTLESEADPSIGEPMTFGWNDLTKPMQTAIASRPAAA